MAKKTLTILRHAKSSWSDFSCPDFERTLNKRGLRDAPFMAKVFHEKYPNGVDLIISSPAKRALKTAQYFKNELGLNDDSFWTDKRLYHADLNNILEVINECPDDFNHLLIAAHNPGLTYFVNEFDSFVTDNLPTSGIVVLNVNVSSWQDFQLGSGEIEHFLFPKQYFQ